MPISLSNPFKSSKSQCQTTTEKAQKSVKDDSSSVYSDAATLVSGREQSAKATTDPQHQKGIDFSSTRYSMVPCLIFAFANLIDLEC
jgi:Flp pilus assembly protein TadB